VRFKEAKNCSDLLNGIDNKMSLDDDKAYGFAQSLWLEVTSTTTQKEDALFSFPEYLELFKFKAKGSTYKLAANTQSLHLYKEADWCAFADYYSVSQLQPCWG
jgi:hypothetical protein